MAITEVQHTSDNASSDDKVPHQDWATVPVPGNLLICVVQWAQRKGNATCTMTGWTQYPAPDGAVSVSLKVAQAVFYKIAGPDEPLRVAAKLTASRWWVISMVEVNSSVTTLGWQPDVHTHTVSTVGSANPSTGATVTTTGAVEYWLAGIAWQSSGTLTAPTNGFAILEQQAVGGADSYKVSGAMLTKVSAAAAPASTSGTLPASRPWIGTIVTFQQQASTVTMSGTLTGFGALTATPRYTTPTLVVQAAFGSGPATQEPTWTNISTYVKSCNWQRGRQNELNQTQAGTATVTLNDPRSHFDPGNTLSPFYPNVKPGMPVRATFFVLDSIYPLFYGFVERLPRTTRVSTVYTERQIDLVDGFAVLANAGLGGMNFVEESSDLRVSSVLDDIGWPTTARQIGPGASTIQEVEFDGNDDTRAQQHLQTVADSENGFLFCDGAGDLVFVGRRDLISDPRYTTSKAVFSDANS